MKKFFLIALIAIMGLVVFSLPKINLSVSATENVININLKLFELSLDKQGHILDYSYYDAKTKKYRQIYQYANDSYNIITDDKELLPESFDYELSENEEYLKLNFYFENNGKKSYTFFNDSYFHFDVDFENLNGKVALPYISSIAGISSNTNKLVSYIKKPLKSVLALNTNNSSIDGLVINLDGSSERVNTYVGPLKLTYIREGLGKDLYQQFKLLLKDVGVINWGTYIYYWFIEFLWFLNNLTGNFGWAIIIFTIVIRLILFPLYHKQTKSMVMMRKLQPEVEKLKKKYKDPRKQQEALMAMYKEKGYNPAGGCLPALLQLPIFILLWQVIQYFSEGFAYNPQFLLWKDLSAGGFSQNILLVLLSLLAYILNAMLSAQDSKTAWQQIFMSAIFPFFLIGLPVGVFIYYTTNAAIQVILTFFANKKNGVSGVGIRELFGLGPKPIRR